MSKQLIVYLACTMCLGRPLSAQVTDQQLSFPDAWTTESSIVWSVSGYAVAISAPRVVNDLTGNPLVVTAGAFRREDHAAHLEFLVRDAEEEAGIRGRVLLDLAWDPASPALRVDESFTLQQSCSLDLRVSMRFRVVDQLALAMVTEDTEFRPLDFYSGTSAIYTRGAVAHAVTDTQPTTAAYRLVDRSTDPGGVDLSMPVVAVTFGGHPDRPPLYLACAVDPFYGVQMSASLAEGHTELVRETIYRGSIAPFSAQERRTVLHWTDAGADGIFNTFYRTVPELEPCAPWARQVAMGYYDYNGDDGQGWYRDLQTLADRIPAQHRGKVACCLHGWYDWLGSYCYDRHTDSLLEAWTAFDNGHPGRAPIPMSKQEMHRKIRFAKSLGFRVVLYYADCTNMTAGKVEQSWCGTDWRRFLYTNKQGQQPAGWTGPCGGGLQLDISQPEVRQWLTDYLRALLREYGDTVDGFVLDETNLFSAGALCQRDNGPPAYGDQMQMRFIRDLTLLVQQHRQRNPDLCLFDGSHYLYGLVTHGSFTDFEGIPLVVDYRNSSIQCCWEDPGIRNVHCLFRTDPDYAYPYGLDVGLSNGHGSDMGPSEMPGARLDEVIAHFLQRVSEGPPNPKIRL